MFGCKGLKYHFLYLFVKGLNPDFSFFAAWILWKEKKVLSERVAELEEQLTEEQRHELEVKLETSEKHIPLICVGDNSEDDDIIFILPEDYSPRKRLKIDHEKKAHRIGDQDNQAKKDLAITYYKPGTNLPHARENCAKIIHPYFLGYSFSAYCVWISCLFLKALQMSKAIVYMW